MSKAATVASLVRNAARSEEDFVQAIQEVFEDGDIERASEFFDRMNVPRSTAGGDLNAELPVIQGAPLTVTDFTEEHTLSVGIQRYLDRHERKIKWHTTHPSIEGVDNVLLLFRAAMTVTNLRLARLIALFQRHEELSPNDWAVARELMNHSYLSFRNFLNITAGEWLEAMNASVEPDALSEKLGSFYELVDQEIRHLEDMRERIEERRLELAVLPEGFPPVRPPNYFHGDLMGRGPWKQFWNQLNQRAHHFRETAF